MPSLLLPEDLFKRSPVFGAGLVDVFKGLAGKIKKFAPTKEGLRFFTGPLSIGAIADKVLPLIQPILNASIRKSIPLLTRAGLEAFGSADTKQDKARLRKAILPASKLLSDSLIQKLGSRIQTSRKKRSKKTTGGRTLKPATQRRANGGRFPRQLGPTTGPSPLTKKNREFLRQLLQMNTVRGSGLMEL